MVAFLVGPAGVRAGLDAAALDALLAEQEFFWLDLVDEPELSARAMLQKLGVAEEDTGWALRFGQAGRLQIGNGRLRGNVWRAEADGLLREIHLLTTPHGLVTVWRGPPESLDDLRQRFFHRAKGVDGDAPLAAALLLQLLLGTLDDLLISVDARLDEMRLTLDRGPPRLDFMAIAPHLRQLQRFSDNFSRFSSAIRSALVGVEALEGVSRRAARELNDYGEQVEDFADQLTDRRRAANDLGHDFSTRIAQAQSAQIDRLTLVSMIFLPLSAITGFFGMNFEWLSENLSGLPIFVILGLALPAFSVLATLGWLWRGGLLGAGGQRKFERDKQDVEHDKQDVARDKQDVAHDKKDS